MHPLTSMLTDYFPQQPQNCLTAQTRSSSSVFNLFISRQHLAQLHSLLFPHLASGYWTLLVLCLLLSFIIFSPTIWALPKTFPPSHVPLLFLQQCWLTLLHHKSVSISICRDRSVNSLQRPCAFWLEVYWLKKTFLDRNFLGTCGGQNILCFRTNEFCSRILI